MLVLSRHHVEQVLTMEDAIAAVADGYRQLAQGNVAMPQRAATVVEPHNGIHLSMPAFVSGVGDDAGTLAIKIVTVFSDNPARYDKPTIQGVVLLHDAATGEPLALMDAEHLTAMRTGAASGVATQALARPDSRVATVLGSGTQAVTQLLAVCTVLPIERAWVYSLNADGDRQFAERMSAQLGLPVERAADLRAAVSAADVICTATTSQKPLFDGAWLREGTHVNGIGSYTRTMRELDTATIVRSRLFVDGRTAAQTEAGDILIPMAEGAITYEHVVGEIGAVLLGQVSGRTSTTDITVFKSVGMAVQDAVVAPLVYRRALERGLGQRVELV